MQEGTARRDILSLKLTQDVPRVPWSTPVKIQGAPESHADAWQAFVDASGKYFYWSGVCTDGACLFRARKLADGSYGKETIIAKTNFTAPSPGDVIAVGEMSITGDGRFLYFVYMQYNSATDLELGLAVARAHVKG